MYRAFVPLLFVASLTSAADPKPRVDSEGFPLPAEAFQRFGSAKFCTDPPRSVAFSPDGKVAFLVPVRIPLWVLADTQPVVSAWEVASGRMLWAFVDQKLVGQQVVADPDGKTVWLAGRIGDRKPEETSAVRIKLAADTGKELDRKELGTSSSDALDLRPDGTLAWNRLDVKESDLTLRILKPDGTDVLGWDPVGQDIGLIRFSPDGAMLYVGGRAFESRGWKLSAVDVSTGKGKWSVNTTMQDTLAVSPDGKVVAIVLSDDPPPSPEMLPRPEDERPKAAKVVGYHTATGAEIGAIPVESNYFLSFRTYQPETGRPLSFTANGQKLLVQNNDRETVTIDPQTWKAGTDLRADWEAHGWRTPDGKSYLGYPRWWYRNLTLYDTATHKPSTPPLLLQRGERGKGVGVAFSPDGGRLFYGGLEYRERVEWEVATGKELARVPWDKLKDQPTMTPRDYAASHYGVFRSPDGKLVYRSIRGTDRDNRHGEVLDVKTGRQVADLALKGWIRPLAFSADSKQVIGVDRGKVGVWDVSNGGEPTTMEGPQYFRDYGRDNQDTLLLDPTANRVVLTEKYDRSDSRTERWRIWRYDLNPLKRSAVCEGLGRLKDVYYTRDGRLVGRCQTERAKPYWAESVFVITPDAEVPATFETGAGGGGFAVSPEGHTVALGTPGGDIHLYELASGKRRHTFHGLHRSATSIAFSPNGRHLASESADGPVLLWDVRGDLTKPAKPDAAGWNAAWKALGEEGAESAFNAVRLFALYPDEGGAELAKRFADQKPPSEEAITALIRKLDDRDFKTREQAGKDLKAMGFAAFPALKKALAGTPSPELQERANMLLAVTMPPDLLRAERAVEAMQLADTDGCRKRLAEWAKGAASDSLTVAARRGGK